MTASAKEKYYAEGATWDYEIYGKLKQSRKRAWIAAAFSACVAVLCLFALVLLLPLKEFSPYVITVNKNTGYLEATRGLKPGDLTQNESVTMFNIVKYITARETYDPRDLQENFNLVMLTSADKAQNEYRALYEKSNPNRPTQLYGYQTIISVTIKNVSFLDKDTATVRFLTEKKASDRPPIEEHWIAIVGFRYVQTPTSLKDRFINPLGFQVTSYRRDQEILTQ